MDDSQPIAPRRKIPRNKRQCRFCGTTFLPEHTTVTFCSYPCAFMAKVDKSPGFGPNGDCWRWTAFASPYGRLTVNGKNMHAHVFSFRHIGGNELPAGMIVCHSCDTPLCVNPAHLFSGTNADNMADKVRKGRQSRGARFSDAIRRAAPRGEQSKASKLTHEQVKQILELYHGGLSFSAIGRMFGVCHSTVARIISGKNWSHVTAGGC